MWGLVLTALVIIVCIGGLWYLKNAVVDHFFAKKKADKEFNDFLANSYYTEVSEDIPND